MFATLKKTLPICLEQMTLICCFKTSKITTIMKLSVRCKHGHKQVFIIDFIYCNSGIVGKLI